MENLNIEGLFWTPEKPDNQVAGRLTFSPARGGKLALLGSLREPHTASNYARIDQILGVGDQRSLLLYKTSRRDWSIEMPGIHRETYTVPIILSNVSSPDVALNFPLIHIEIDHFDDWIGTSTISEAAIADKIQVNVGPINTFRVEPLGAEECSDDGSFRIFTGFTCRSDSIARKIIDIHTILSVKRLDPVPLADIVEIGSALQILIGLALGEPSPVRRVLLFTKPPSSDVYELSMARAKDAVELFGTFGGTETSPSKSFFHHSEMLFTFEDIGGLVGVVKWLGVYRKYRLVIEMLISHWRQPQMYVENRFANILIASEAFVRIREQQQNISYRNKIQQLIQSVAAFGELVGDVAAWLDEVMRTRTRLVIHPGLEEEVDNLRIHLLAESLYFLVVMLLLKECDLSREAFRRLTVHQRFRELASRLGESGSVAASSAGMGR